MKSKKQLDFGIRETQLKSCTNYFLCNFEQVLKSFNLDFLLYKKRTIIYASEKVVRGQLDYLCELDTRWWAEQ